MMPDHVIERCQCEGKFCKGCGKVQCTALFGRSKSAKDGLQSSCNACRKAYREENRERILAARKEYYQRNRERHMTYSKAYATSHPEKTKAIQSAFRSRRRSDPGYQEHLIKERLQKKAYRGTPAYRASRDANRERLRAFSKKFQRENPAYFASHDAKRRSKKRQNGSFTQREWNALKASYNFTCLCCGKREPDIKLAADHVVPIVKDGGNTIANIQPLCISCNAKKYDKFIDYRPLWSQDLEG